MPIALPPAIEGIDLPAVPAHPPTLNDVVEAKNYKAHIDVAYSQPLPPPGLSLIKS